MARSKRILWLSHVVPYPPVGGVLQRSYHLLRAVSRGNHVVLVAWVQRAWLRDAYKDVSLGLEEARNELRALCAEVHFVDLPFGDGRIGRAVRLARGAVSSRGYTGSWLDGARQRRVVANATAGRTFDVGHVDTISLDPFRDLVRSRVCVLTHHNAESHMVRRRSQSEASVLRRCYLNREAELLERLERKVCPQYGANITCSEIDAQRLRAVVGRCRFDVVPNGVDVDYFTPTKATDGRPTVVFVGNMAWYPNREAVRRLARDIWPRLTNAVPGVAADLVGANPPVEALALAARDPAWRVHGYVHDVRPIVARATAYMCPISDGGGTRLKVLDAMAMGKALIADPIACEGIDVKDQRNVLLANRPEDYVNGFLTLLNAPEYRTYIEANARSLIVEKYAFSSLGRRLEQIYDDLLEGADRLGAAEDRSGVCCRSPTRLN